MQKFLIVLLLFSPIIADSATEKLKELAEKINELDSPFLSDDIRKKLSYMRDLANEIGASISEKKQTNNLLKDFGVKMQNEKLKRENAEMKESILALGRQAKKVVRENKRIRGDLLRLLATREAEKAAMVFEMMKAHFNFIEIVLSSDGKSTFSYKGSTWTKKVSGWFTLRKELDKANIEKGTIFIVFSSSEKLLQYVKNYCRAYKFICCAKIDSARTELNQILKKHQEEKRITQLEDSTNAALLSIAKENFNIFEVTMKSDNQFKISNHGKEHLAKCNSEEEFSRFFQKVVPRSVQIDSTRSIFLVLMEPKSVYLHRAWVEGELKKMKVIYDLHLLAEAE